MVDEFLAYVLAASRATSVTALEPAPIEHDVRRATEGRRLASHGLPDPIWARPALGMVLLLASGLYLWGLSRNGLANQYYAAAVLSMSQSWSNFFFASFDPGGFITVDKPPFALWVQAISVRIFGLNSWTILVPQAIAGVAAVLVVHHLVQRIFGHAAALISALVLALTPVTVAVNRDNLPDGILVLLLVLAAWGVLNAISSPHMRPLLVGAVLVGLAFNTKMLQAYLVVPAFGLAYLCAGVGSLRRRLVSLAAAGLVLTVVSASWMVVVDAFPPDARPFIGGSSNNTVLDLVMGYNGLGRIFGNGFRGGGGVGDGPSGMPGIQGLAGGNGVPPIAIGSGRQAPPISPPGPVNGRPGFGGGPGGGPNFGGQPGLLRLFNELNGAQIGWLLPLATLAVAGGAFGRRGATRSDPARAFFLLWGTWLATHFVVFSLARGIFHPYYSVAMGPAIAALAGAGLIMFWRWYRQGGLAALVLPSALGISAAWPLVLVSRSSWGQPWLPIGIACGIGLAITGLLVVQVAHRFRREALWPLAGPALALGLLAVLAGPGLWSVSTLEASQSAITPAGGPSGTFAGPDQAQAPGDGQGQGFAEAAAGRSGGQNLGVGPRGARGPDGVGQAPLLAGGTAPPDRNSVSPPADGVGPPPDEGAPPLGELGPALALPRNVGPPANIDARTGGGPRFGRGPGGRGAANEQMIQFLLTNQGTARFLLATTGSMGAAPIIIATGKPVIAMGGFSGSDPAPTAERLHQLVQSGELRYVLAGGGPGGGNQRTDWVRAACSLVDPTVYGGSTDGGGGQLYDCAGASATGAW